MITLVDQVRMWPTPCANDRPNEGNVRLLRAKVESGEMAEAEAEAMLHGKSPFSAQGKVPAKWPTPRAGMPGSRKPGTGGKVLAEEAKRGAEPGGQLNPDWVEPLMGFPRGWTDLGRTESPEWRVGFPTE